MTQIRAGRLTRKYEVFFPADGEPLVRIADLGIGSLAWPKSLSRPLAGRGFGVLRFGRRKAVIGDPA